MRMRMRMRKLTTLSELILISISAMYTSRKIISRLTHAPLRLQATVQAGPYNHTVGYTVMLHGAACDHAVHDGTDSTAVERGACGPTHRPMKAFWKLSHRYGPLASRYVLRNSCAHAGGRISEGRKIRMQREYIYQHAT